MMVEPYKIPAQLFLTFKVSADQIVLIRPTNTVNKEIIEGKREAIINTLIARDYFEVPPVDQLHLPNELEVVGMQLAKEFCRATLKPITLRNPNFKITIIKVRAAKIA